MRKSVLAMIIAAPVLLGVAPTEGRAVAIAPGPAPSVSDFVQDTAIVCGAWGCSWTWPGRHRGWGWPRPWSTYYPPACPEHYHYDCRPGPYGNRDCACWPNW